MCFSLAWLEQLLIWIVIIVAIFSLLKLVVPWILSKLGAEGGIVMQAISIVLWAFIAICIIYFIFMLISCLLSMGGGLPGFPHR
jgi:hypothetical protein